jgi:hypothetical protein
VTRKSLGIFVNILYILAIDHSKIETIIYN